MAMAPRATAACALAALLLALAATDSEGGLFDFFGDADGDTTTAPVVSTESSASASGGRIRSSKSSHDSEKQSKNSRSSKRRDMKPVIEVEVLPPGQTSSGSRGRNGRTRHSSKANATITVVPHPPSKVQKGTKEEDPEETVPTEPPPPLAEQRSASPMFPPTVITETVHMEDGKMVANVDVPAEAPMLAGNVQGSDASPSIAEISGSPDSQSVWGPYPTELNSMPLDYTGMEQDPFPYGYNSFPPPWWQTRPFTRARNAWYPMSQASYHPWRSYRSYDLPPMMNPYTQMWLRGRGRRQTMLPQDPFDMEDIAGIPPVPWSDNINNPYFGYSGWPPYTPPMRMYMPPNVYPWGQFSTRWVSKPLAQGASQPAGSNAPALPPSPQPSPSLPHGDVQSTGREKQPPAHGDAQHQQAHPIRHLQHHLRAPMRLPQPSWQLQQQQYSRWPSVASLPQMLPLQRYKPARAGPALTAAGQPSAPQRSPPSADSEATFNDD